jgi:ABC-2 type transport system ATP-binding protein
MDEAEYCHRVGMMRSGRLLAMDTPLALKEQFVPGNVYEIYAAPLLTILAALEANPIVLRAGLAGDHLRVIAKKEAQEVGLRQVLEQAGVEVQAILPGEPGLEDVFIHLAKERT